MCNRRRLTGSTTRYEVEQTVAGSKINKRNRNGFFNWDSHHAWLNSHSKQWSYKKMKHKKTKAYRKSL